MACAEIDERSMTTGVRFVCFKNLGDLRWLPGAPGGSIAT